MKRDYQALALANSLDPKRFMKGGTKLNKVPEAFAVSATDTDLLSCPSLLRVRQYIHDGDDTGAWCSSCS
jgi:hypothetical protein